MMFCLPRLEAAEHVERYAWFASRFPSQGRPGDNWHLSAKNSLLKPNLSQRTALGDLYISH